MRLLLVVNERSINFSDSFTDTKGHSKEGSEYMKQVTGTHESSQILQSKFIFASHLPRELGPISFSFSLLQETAGITPRRHVESMCQNITSQATNHRTNRMQGSHFEDQKFRFYCAGLILAFQKACCANFRCWSVEKVCLANQSLMSGEATEAHEPFCSDHCRLAIKSSTTELSAVNLLQGD